MSLRMRAVTETWGEHTSQFIGREALLNLLTEIAENRCQSSTSQNDYGDVTSVYIGKGGEFLDFIERKPGSDNWTVDQLAECLTEDWGELVEIDRLHDLMNNLQSLAPSWRKMIGEGGELHIYLD